METLGVGIIGCGWVAEEYIKAFSEDPRSEIRALAGRSTEKPEAYRRKYGLDCRVTTDAEATVARDDIDVVVVCTPHDVHTPYVVAAATSGKHIIIEKPVALTIEDVRRQQAAVKEAGVKTMVSFVLRWNPLLLCIDRLLDQEAFGNVFLVEVDYMHRIWCSPDHWYGTRARGGSSMLAAGCHAVDAMRWFARSEAVEVNAYQVKTENPAEYPGTTAALVQFENGKIGRTTSCFDARMPYVFHVGVYGTEGSIRNEKVFAPKVFPGQTGFMTIPTICPDSGDVSLHPFRTEVQRFLDAIVNDTRPMPDLEDAVKTMEICLAADRSAEEGRPVRIEELR